MLSDDNVLHQMVLPEQQSFYNYWLSKCDGDIFPSRDDIFPSDISKQLPMTSIINVENDEGRRFKYRLAGTGFWKLYKSEIQGKFIDELPIGDRSDYWNRVLGKVVDKRKPYAGVTQPGTINAANYALFWVRLPISDNKKDINLILGYDHLVKISEVKQDQSRSGLMTA